jgi:hypothetical protein
MSLKAERTFARRQNTRRTHFFSLEKAEAANGSTQKWKLSARQLPKQ